MTKRAMLLTAALTLAAPATGETLREALAEAWASNPALAAARARQEALAEAPEQARAAGRLTAAATGNGGYDDLGYGREFDHLPMIWPILYKSISYALLFVIFHEFEHFVVAWINGRLSTFSLPTLAGGSWAGAACVWGAMTLSLMPFFAIREVSKLVGVRRVWSLMFRPGARAAFAAAEAKQKGT